MVFLQCFNVLIYALLVYFVLDNMIFGPIHRLRENRSQMVTDYIQTQDLPPDLRARLLPTLTLCRFPSFRDVNPFFLLNESHSSNLSTFLKSHQYIYPDDFVYLFEVGINNSYMVPVDFRHYLRPFLTDTFYFGYCLLADLSVIFEQHLGDIARETPITSINIVFRDHDADIQSGERPPSYMAYFQDRDEELMLSGPCALGDNPYFNRFVQARPGLGSIHDFEPILVEDLRECDQGHVKLSKCVEKHLNQTVNNCTSDDVELKRCSLQDFKRRWEYLTSLKTEGYDHLAQVSQCHLPCQRMVCQLNEVIAGETWQVFPDPILSHVPRDSAAIRIRFPKYSRIKHHQEILVYPINALVGDIGGIMGLFLGLSFWGLFKTVKQVIMRLVKHSQ